MAATSVRLGLAWGCSPARLAYIVSPVDLVPEAVLPVLGTVDDAVVISWAVKTLVDETDRFLAWEAGEGLGGSPRTVRGVSGQAARPEC